MSKAEIYIVVEGQTEQTFVRDVLAPYLSYRGIYLHSASIGKPGHKGGDIRFDRAKVDVGNFLKQRPDTYISTMFDFFRIDKNWPGLAHIHQVIKDGKTLTASQKAEILETASLQEIEKVFPNANVKKRFIPYIQMHEFEALLFSDESILAEQAGIDIFRVQAILTRFINPEEINEDPANAPSKQLEILNPGYRKVVLGKIISESIGIQTIRGRCPHFSDWLTKLENLVE